MTGAYNTLLNSLNFKIADLPEMKQYQVLMLCNMLVDTVAVTKDYSEREKELFDLVDRIETQYPKVFDKVQQQAREAV